MVIEAYFRYNNSDDLKQIIFDEISEKYTSKDYHYVVGKVNLTHLIANRDYILKNNLFVSLVDEKVSLAKDETRKTVLKKELAA